MVKAFEDLLRSHGPRGICQHELMQTTLSFILLSWRWEMWATDGPPCTSDFVRHTLFGGRRSSGLNAGTYDMEGRLVVHWR